MRRLLFSVLMSLTFLFLPQYLLAEDPAGPPGPPQTQPAGPNPEILFNRLDANHDGFITQDELPPGMPEMFKQLLFLADGNGDGKITLAELTDALNQHRLGPGRDVNAGSQIKMIPLLNANATEAAKIIGQVYRDQKLPITISIDTRTNALIVRAPESLFEEIKQLVQKLDEKTPDSNAQPSVRRFRGPEGQADQVPGPPFGRRFGGSEGRPDEMAGPPFGRQGMGPGWMGGPGGRLGQMAGPPFRVPGEEPPQKSAGADGPEGSVRVEAYSVNKADPQTTLKVMQTLLAGKPDVRMDIDPKTNNLIVLARPAEHATIRATLEKMQHDGQGSTDAKEKPTEMPGPPFGGRGGQPDQMGGPPFGRQGMGPGWMAGQGFGGRGMGPGWMAGQHFDSPEPGSDRMPGPPFGGPGGQRGWMPGPPFGRGGPGGRPPQMAGHNFPGPNAGPHWMGGSPFIGPEGRPWAGPGYGPPHPWMAYRAGPRRTWPLYGQNWYQQLLTYNARPPHQGFNPKAIFDRLDTNHDNQLSFDEFSQGMKRMFQAIAHRGGPPAVRPVSHQGPRGFGPQWY